MIVCKYIGMVYAPQDMTHCQMSLISLVLKKDNKRIQMILNSHPDNALHTFFNK